jgi:hypothetical protein
MLFSTVSALFAAGLSLSCPREHHAALGAATRMVVNDIRVHRAGMDLVGGAR